MPYAPRIPEPVVDFLLPPRYPTRYRVRLLAISRNEAQLAFAYRPRVFRSGELWTCRAEMTLVHAFEVAQARGELELPESAEAPRARLRFASPLAFHVVRFFRRACGLPSSREEEASRNPVPSEAGFILLGPENEVLDSDEAVYGATG